MLINFSIRGEVSVVVFIMSGIPSKITNGKGGNNVNSNSPYAAASVAKQTFPRNYTNGSCLKLSGQRGTKKKQYVYVLLQPHSSIEVYVCPVSQRYNSFDGMTRLG